MEKFRQHLILANERMKLLPLWALLWLSYFVVYRFILLRPFLNDFSAQTSLALDVAVPQAFLFDGVVIGFFLLPIWALNFLPKFWSVILQKLTWIFVFAVVAVVSTLDLLCYSARGRRFRASEMSSLSWTELWESSPREIWGNLILLCIVLALALYIFKIKVKRSPRRLMWIEIVCRHLLVLGLLVVLARGSFSQHHLRREDALVSEHRPLVEWIYNPVWVFDKVD